MKRTYGGRRATGTGALDYRELLQSVDTSSTIFDALSIKNLKQLKRDTSSSYLTWNNQRTGHKRVVNRVRKRESPLTNVHDCTPVESCLTPDKSLRVNRAPDSFDQLWECPRNDSLHVKREENDLFDQLLSSSPEKKSQKNQHIATDTNLNLSSEKSINKSEHQHNAKGRKRNRSIPKKKILHGSSDFHKYNLQVEGEKKNEALSNSIKNIVNNASFLKALINRRLSKTMVRNPRNSNAQNNLTPIKQIEPLTSTPYTKKYGKKYSMNVSPIQIKVLQNQKLSVPQSYPNHSMIGSNESFKNTHADNLDELEDPIISKQTFQTSISNNILENDNISIISVHSDLEGEPFLGFSKVPRSHVSEVHKIKDLSNSIDSIIDKITSSDSNNKKSNQFPNMLSTITNANLSLGSADKSSNSSSDSETSSSTSLYNTCSTDKSTQQESQDYKIAEPRVCIERLRDSMLYKHYQITNKNESSNSSSSLSVEDMLEHQKQHCSVNEEEEEDQQSMACNFLKIGLTENNNESDGKCDLGTSNVDKDSSNDVDKSSKLNEKSLEKIFLKADFSVLEENVDEVRESISISSESSFGLSQNDTGSVSSESAANSNSSINSSLSKSYERTAKINTAQRMTSFVTTRRRNVMDNSGLIDLDDTFNSSVLNCNGDIADNVNPQESVAECKSVVDTRNKNTELTASQSKTKTEIYSITQNESPCLFIKSNNIQSSIHNISEDVEPNSNSREHPVRLSILLKPGKKWGRSLSLYRRQTMHQNHTVHEDTIQEESSPNNSIYNEILVQSSAQNQKGTAYLNDSVCDRRNSVLRNLRRSTIRIVKEPANVRASFSASPLLEDDIGFLSEDCDDTLAELSKLSISDSALDITVLEKRPEERQTSARDVVLRRCNQTDVLPFHECYPDSVLKNCRKIGEGVYGEVFLYRGQDGRGRVMKVVPVEGALLVNQEHQKTFKEVISEVVIAMELSALRAPIEDIERHCDDERDNSGLDLSSVENATDTFNEVLAVRCVYGAYPARLLDLWELYYESKGSDNDNPVVLPPDQLYIVLELANAGQDLESYQFNSAEQAYALFYQVAFALAVGEESYQFEHRDLHWGNVLIQPTDQKFARYVLNGRMHSVPRCGVAATIIDYTLSRVTLPIAGGEQLTVYNNLAADENLFHADGSEDYQFDIYRHMREKTGNDWEKFEPYTNILWLHYTVDKMITALRYKRTNTKIHKHYIAKLKGIRNRLLDYNSAAHFVLTDNHI